MVSARSAARTLSRCRHAPSAFAERLALGAIFRLVDLAAREAFGQNLMAAGDGRPRIDMRRARPEFVIQPHGQEDQADQGEQQEHRSHHQDMGLLAVPAAAAPHRAVIAQQGRRIERPGRRCDEKARGEQGGEGGKGDNNARGGHGGFMW